jgi:AAA+ superfamily predicted ATPase
MTATEQTSIAEKSAEPWASWEPCDETQGAEALERLARNLPKIFADSKLITSRQARLSFYESHRLLELVFVRDRGAERAFVLDGPRGTAWLNGESGPIHDTNEAESLALTKATAADYVRFFFYFLRADDGAFVLIESGEEVGPADDVGEPSDGEAGALSLEQARSKACPVKMHKSDSDERWVSDITVAYGGTLFSSSLAVEPDGNVEMTDDDVIGELGGLAVPQAPSLALQAKAGDREITQAVVAVLLEDALQELNADTRAGTVLLRHFNPQTQATKPSEQLSRLLESHAIVIIESDIPFVEDVVAQLVAGVETARDAVRASALQPGYDDLRCDITVNESSKLYLLSMHAYRSLFDAERTAHDLSFSDAAVLIGCNRAADVPEPLRRIADSILTFPAIDRRRFGRIFEGVFDAKPAEGWDAGGADWTHFLVPGDFHMARRLALGPDDALSVLRDRVQARLSQVTPDDGPGLDNLYGIGEARQIAEDLIADIQAAQVEQIPWSVVDKGLLLVGAPGTGKTTLARAVAKECGVKFVVASAAKWQSAGALDEHLRAMRSDFAEARRYAPAILFIDELDSIGSRENLSGPSAVYQTDVINALLEEIQGIGSTDPVIVIGATNYVEKIDPALRRAGRLDQIVEIPLPNVEGLECIFGYHLSRFSASGGALASDIDKRALAELAFGLTGADVEFFVRGAARRARRENRPVDQKDVVAEITRRPRRPDSAPRLTPHEMHRVAVHEAGHTVARLISSTHGVDLTFASIIPRLDGSLGFTAAVPTNTRVLTRQMMVEELETVLAGRAAEEVVFGADQIGGGAGGTSSSSDLAVATNLATLIVCQSGLGADGFLRWTTEPTAEQNEKINELINAAYRNIRSRLQTCRELFDRVAAALEDKQELSGKELRGLATSISAEATPA